MKREKDKKIKAILFDLGNVLLNYDLGKLARDFAKHCHVSLTRVWLHFIASPWEGKYARGEISSYEFYRHAKKLSKQPLSYLLFRHYWNDIFWENRGMENLLVRLKKHYPLYLISNTNAMHFRHIKKKFKVLRHFKKTFPSHEVGHRKPEKEIYEYVLKKIRLTGPETVFIDDMPSFVRGAKKAGIRAIRFRNKPELVRDLKKLGVRL